jgi:hypothetical protein
MSKDTLLNINLPRPIGQVQAGLRQSTLTRITGFGNLDKALVVKRRNGDEWVFADHLAHLTILEGIRRIQR